MGVFGLWVLGITAWHVWHGTLPHAATMGAVGVAALIANAASAFRGGAPIRAPLVLSITQLMCSLVGVSACPLPSTSGSREATA